VPIFVGGTGLYFKALTNGLVNIPNIPIRFKSKIRVLHSTLGQKKFYQNLLKIDPSSKNIINPTDTQRSIRAYEVKKFTKKSIYEWYKLTKSDFKEFEIYKIFLNSPREKILKNISQRTKEMIKNNCINEVKDFLKLKIDPALSVNKIIGVKEIKDYLDQKIDLNQVIELINIKTRQYAKRQVTWSRGHMIDWKREYSNSFRELSKNILKLLS
jgi:tRNA dimethylallyltransferase